MKTRKFPRPARRPRAQFFEVTNAGLREVLPTTPIEYEVTPAGKGEYLPTQGKFIPGEDERRHKLTPLECSLGGHSAAFNLLLHFADTYCETDEEYEALAGSRLNTILTIRAQMHGQHVAC